MLPETPLARGQRESPPSRRQSTGYELRANGAALHVGLGWADDGRLLEVRLNSKHINSPQLLPLQEWAVATSRALQYGAPVREVCDLRGGGTEDLVVLCEPVTGLHGRRVGSYLEAVVRLVQLETDEQGRRRG